MQSDWVIETGFFLPKKLVVTGTWSDEMSSRSNSRFGSLCFCVLAIACLCCCSPTDELNNQTSDSSALTSTGIEGFDAEYDSMGSRGIRGSEFNKLSTMVVYAAEADDQYSAFLERARTTVKSGLDIRGVSFERLVNLLQSEEYEELEVLAGDIGPSSDWGPGLRELTASELLRMRAALKVE